jgi:hypothetical protein
VSEQEAKEEYARLLKQIGDVAAVAGIQGEVDAEMGAYCTGFRTAENRRHRVFVRPTATAPGGKPVVTIYAVAKSFPKKKVAAAIPQKELMALLLKNENLMFARFGIRELEEEYLLVASADHLLDTLDADEFNASARYVANAADAYEASQGEEDTL